MQNKLNRILEKFKKHDGNLISLLQDIQEEFGYIPEEIVNSLAKKLEIPPSNFFGVATFYSQFHLKPRGRKIVTACCGTACHVKGADNVIKTIQKELNLSDEKQTTDDGEITLEKVACVGTCSYAPVVLINKEVHGKVTSEQIKKELKTLRGAGNG